VGEKKIAQGWPGEKGHDGLGQSFARQVTLFLPPQNAAKILIARIRSRSRRPYRAAARSLLF
jgi:hypothetical protein